MEIWCCSYFVLLLYSSMSSKIENKYELIVFLLLLGFVEEQMTHNCYTVCSYLNLLLLSPLPFKNLLSNVWVWHILIQDVM